MCFDDFKADVGDIVRSGGALLVRFRGVFLNPTFSIYKQKMHFFCLESVVDGFVENLESFFRSFRVRVYFVFEDDASVNNDTAPCR